jgi:peptidoglycan/xylan/chitin deacetylase (PgdA/CDA1 family)
MYQFPFRWPDGAYIALTFDLAWEAWPGDLGMPGSTQRGGGRPFMANAVHKRDLSTIYQHAFAERGGMQRAMDLFDRHGVKLTVLACGLAVERFPAIARELFDRGHDMSSENWDHQYAALQTLDEERADIARTVRAFEQALGVPPSGYTSSGGLATPHTYRLVAEQGYRWIGDFTHSEVPFVRTIGERRLVCVSHCLHHDYVNVTPRQLTAQWKDDFDALYAEGRRGWPKMLSFGFHSYLLRGFRTLQIEEQIAYAKSHPRVWFARKADIAAWVLENYPDLTLDDFYPESAQSTAIYELP